MRNVRPGQTVLDLGCGTGTISVLMLQQVPDLVVYSADSSPSALRAAQRNAARSGVSPRFFDAHAEALPFDRAMLDSLLYILTLHHIPDALKAAALREVRRVLNSDGQFLLADFETKRNPFFWGKYRSSKTLECWLSIAAFKPQLVGRGRGVHAFIG